MDRGARSRGARRPRSMPWRLGGLAAACASGALLLTAPCADAAPVNTSLPVISGVLDAGQTLTATPGSWTDNGATVSSYWYQWELCQDDCTFISYANSPTYTITDADNGEQIGVEVTAYDSAGDSTGAVSNQTFVVGLGYTLGGTGYTLSESTVGNGSVTGFATGMEAAGRTADANLTCPGSCGALDPYPSGTEIELIATPWPGSTFLGWGGACSGSAPTCSLTMSSDEAVVAAFSGQATTSPVTALGHEDEAGEAPPPVAVAPSLGAWEAPPSALSLPARLLGIGYRRRHVQAEVECEQVRPCRLSLALFAGTRTAQAMIARRSFAVPAQRSTRISLVLDREGKRILARRHKLPITARLMLSGTGRASLVGQRRFTLTG